MNLDASLRLDRQEAFSAEVLARRRVLRVADSLILNGRLVWVYTCTHEREELLEVLADILDDVRVLEESLAQL